MKTEEMDFEYFWGTAWKKAIPAASIEGPNVHKSQYIPLEVCTSVLYGLLLSLLSKFKQEKGR